MEIWNGHEIRFVEKNPGDWWAVAADVSNALGYRMASDMTRYIDNQDKGTLPTRTPSGEQEMLIISEEGIYDAILTAAKNLRNKEMREKAKEFKRWVFKVIKTLRQTSGLEGFQIFRMLDKEHQREMMKSLSDKMRNPVRVDFIKANTVANKAVSSLYGHPKMLKKEQMTSEMLVARQSVLDDTVNLMVANDSFKMNLSVSDMVYAKYLLPDHATKKTGA